MSATISVPFKTTRNRNRDPYGQSVALSRAPSTSEVGFDTNSALEWAKENKWYLLAGGLFAAAGVAYLYSRHSTPVPTW